MLKYAIITSASFGTQEMQGQVECIALWDTLFHTEHSCCVFSANVLDHMGILTHTEMCIWHIWHYFEHMLPKNTGVLYRRMQCTQHYHYEPYVISAANRSRVKNFCARQMNAIKKHLYTAYIILYKTVCSMQYIRSRPIHKCTLKTP